VSRLLRYVVTCVDPAAPCGVLASGLDTDPPGPKPRGWKGPYGDGSWTRADELDRLAEKHAKTHATHIGAGPEES
jgi:hypothetical protein